MIAVRRFLEPFSLVDTFIVTYWNIRESYTKKVRNLSVKPTSLTLHPHKIEASLKAHQTPKHFSYGAFIL